jgi:hypothetical protein
LRKSMLGGHTALSGAAGCGLLCFASLEPRNRRDAHAWWWYRSYLESSAGPARVDRHTDQRANCSRVWSGHFSMSCCFLLARG